MRVLVFLLIFLLIPFPALAWQSWQGRVVNVDDGDSITVLTPGNRQIRVRLYGIDCPERRQAFGNRARQATEKYVKGQTVEIQAMDIDSYERTVAVVYLPSGNSLNELLISEGLAWVYPQYCNVDFICDPLRRLEAAAKAGKRGLWADKNPVEPWNWRKQIRGAGNGSYYQ